VLKESFFRPARHVVTWKFVGESKADYKILLVKPVVTMWLGHSYMLCINRCLINSNMLNVLLTVCSIHRSVGFAIADYFAATPTAVGVARNLLCGNRRVGVGDGSPPLGSRGTALMRIRGHSPQKPLLNVQLNMWALMCYSHRLSQIPYYLASDYTLKKCPPRMGMSIRVALGCMSPWLCYATGHCNWQDYLLHHNSGYCFTSSESCVMTLWIRSHITGIHCKL